MFFKKRNSPEIVEKRKDQVVAWDQKTVEFFAKSEQINVQITNVGKRTGFGAMREHEAMRDPNGYEVSGVITYHKLILVSISFDANSENFGEWFYNLYNHASKPQKIEIPFLELYLSDPSYKMASAMFEAHQAALLSGQRYSLARFWKRKGDGVMTEKDREHGYSYESRYPLLGLYTWAEIESMKLPKWAVPRASERFSIENLPEWYDLKL